MFDILGFMKFESFKRVSAEREKGDSINSLLDEFPEALQERLEEQVADMEDQVARDFLMEKLALRNETLAKSFEDIAPGIEVAKQVPESFKKNVLEVVGAGDTFLVGEGKSAHVFRLEGQSNVCFKVLRKEVVRQLQKNVVREGIYQYRIAELLTASVDCARSPEVLFLADDQDMQVIMMEYVNGSSLRDIFEGKGSLPEKFDIDLCFSKLERAVEEMHAAGYFHRDLTNNPGNVMIDTEGNPWIIDFGSTIKSVDPERSTTTFQLQLNGAHFLSSDLDGVRKLKRRLNLFLTSKEEVYE